MSSYTGVLISDQLLQSQFTQVELRSLHSKVRIFCSLIIYCLSRSLFGCCYRMILEDVVWFWLLCCCFGQFTSVKNQNGIVTAGDLPALMVTSKAFKETHTEEEIRNILSRLGSNLSAEIDFESFLKVSHFLFSNSKTCGQTHNFFCLFYCSGIWSMWHFMSFAFM